MDRAVGYIFIAIITCAFFGAGGLMIKNIKPKTLIEDDQPDMGEDHVNDLHLRATEDESGPEDA
ncbi:hypothetical protein MOV66_19310 [Agrobacterium sp. SHOUNA12C]|uniref:Uncharacterized protein n=1 Tax=Rhizobium rhizogenes NBRC 13257 TaxID=1220581 RepID=A0AA87U391_RHIRH|nr:hypothetical protein [Rhizobium rhizogenes]MCJ9719315.1 hypothetical protein [Agrobacterium sp. BETTINA12B]MCJ9758805.1 hypothetical protein [Agrobacterium sp. SHOUNA12C]NTF50884.1 hypothetical protein [Rhizobium rhizogenes]NTF57576.1 hypothetical protein [Rhizobium rhizogenes]NTF77158.1 hypothetical protein [Rhizobium rhizogenes]